MVFETVIFVTISSIISLISFISSGYLLYKDHKYYNDNKEINGKLYIDNIDIKLKKLYGEPY